MLPIETNLNRIEKLSIQRENENFRFRSFLKGLDSRKVDRIVHRLHREITNQIDCLECGNCCHSLTPTVTSEEISHLAALENMDEETFEIQYLDIDQFQGSKFLKGLPCKYLNGKECTIYKDRPADCHSYPHTHKWGFTRRTLSVISNYGICPIVFNILENLKIQLHYTDMPNK